MMTRSGPADHTFLAQVAKKEELYYSECEDGTARNDGKRLDHLNSDGLAAALGKTIDAAECLPPGRTAALAEALLDAHKCRAVKDAKARRLAKEAVASSTVRNSERAAAPWEYRGSGRTFADNRVKGGLATSGARAIRTDSSYMETSPTFSHRGEINWFGQSPRQPRASHLLASGGVSVAGSTSSSAIANNVGSARVTSAGINLLASANSEVAVI